MIKRFGIQCEHNNPSTEHPSVNNYNGFASKFSFLIKLILDWINDVAHPELLMLFEEQTKIQCVRKITF